MLPQEQLIARVRELCQVDDGLVAARLAEGRTEHWLTPSRRAEADLPADLVAAISRATATADPHSLTAALAAAWRCGRALWLRLADETPAALFAELDRRYPPTGS